MNPQVKMRTANGNSAYGSHVMQYGDKSISKDDLFLYIGTNPANDNYTFMDDNSLRLPTRAVNQRDADLIHFWAKVLSWALFWIFLFSHLPINLEDHLRLLAILGGVLLEIFCRFRRSFTDIYL